MHCEIILRLKSRNYCFSFVLCRFVRALVAAVIEILWWNFNRNLDISKELLFEMLLVARSVCWASMLQNFVGKHYQITVVGIGLQKHQPQGISLCGIHWTLFNWTQALVLRRSCAL